MIYLLFIVLIIGGIVFYKKSADKKRIPIKEYTLVSEELIIAFLDNAEVRQHRYHYDSAKDKDAFLNKDFRYSLAEQRAGIDNIWFQKKHTTEYDLKQNRINYIESLELNEVRIPLLFDGKEMQAVAAMDIDRSTLEIHLFNEKEVKVLAQKYEAKSGEVKYDCIFGFDFLLSDSKYGEMYYTTYMLYSNIS
ncbi:hypothetical protein [Myroides profundi]|uniref:Uncharacterized protein n=1 Tax=Myroides profundi TaxID=480520 RepID=A0AAJ4W663_MYRPR|nr:hypothetical protein [Myroides profundi]AJH16168.1 hypothetical protein MPR_3030 [Myroides profundi]SER37106.1 hypothetical protein SAMN04488089_11452 [Myroides profundi]